MKKNARLLALVLAAALALSLLAGCGPAREMPSSGSDEPEQPGIVLTDQVGREVVLEEPAERVVSAYYLSSSLLVALGAREKVVGIEMKADTRGLYKLAAPEFLELPAVGSGKGVNVEETAALEPDLVILPKKLAEQTAQFDALEIPCLVIDPETLEGFWEAVDLIAAATGTEEQGARLVQYQRDVMERVTTLCAETEGRPSVYLAGSDFLRTVGSGMYQNQLIEMCGGVNAAMAFEDSAWVDISPEELVSWNPDRIYMVSYAEYSRDDVLNDERFRGLAALQQEQTDFLVFPGAIEPWDYPTASMALGALWLGHQLHPEVVTEEEYVTEAQYFFREFFGIEVSAEDLLAH